MAGAIKTDGTGAFVAKVNASGTSLVYLMFFAGLPPGYVPPGALVWVSFLGGTALDQANTIALDAAGDVWVNGIPQSADFPASNGFPGGGEFLVEFNPSGSSLLYAARFPGDTVAAALALDPGGVLDAAGYRPGVGHLVGRENRVRASSAGWCSRRKPCGTRCPCRTDLNIRVGDL
jgi:hypothetical protein